MKLELMTERMKLTPLALADIDVAMEMFTDPDVVKFIGDEIMNEDKIRQEMPTWTKRGGDGCIGIWCISDRNTGEKYGSCFLLPMPIDEDDTNWDLVIPKVMPEGDIEVGYILKQTSWGKGIATEVCRRLLKFAFEDTLIQEVVATIDDDNHRSKNVIEKAGFVYKGWMRAYAEDNPYYCINREEWIELTKNEHN
jgi:ribosomal-protein-alanine N-acetyltransferase